MKRKKKSDRPLRLKDLVRDKVFEKYHKLVNMSFNELRGWANNPCSRKASLDRRPIRRNLELLKTPKFKWNAKHVRWANKTISFVKRMKNVKAGKPVGDGCPFSKRTISLKNWGYDPNK